MGGVMSEDLKQQAWMRIAKRTSQVINLGWWVEGLRLPAVVASLFFAAGILRVRQLQEHPDWRLLFSVLLVCVVLLLLVCWWLARKYFEKPEQSLVRLESQMQLNNALSSAMAGMRSWPEVPTQIDRGVEWRGARVLLPVLAAIGIVLAAVYIPVGAVGIDSYEQTAPKAFLDLAESIEELELEQVVDEEYIEQIEEQMQGLEDANSEDWFDHASLEAIDSLREAHQNNAAELEQALRSSENALKNLQNHGEEMNDAMRQRQLNDFQNALNAMNEGSMRPNKELLERLKNLDPSALDGLSQEQLDQMRQQMRENAQSLNEQKGQEPGDGIGEGPGEYAEGEVEGEGEGLGNGGVDRGPGHAPSVLGGEKDPLATGNMEGIDPKTLGDDLPGDLLETRSLDHPVDESQSWTQQGGGLRSQGEGGERVWQNELLPKEQKALKKFFK